MENYKPTPEDFNKAEEAMNPKQIEMTKKKEDLMDDEENLKDEIELVKKEGGKTVVKSKNIKEIQTYLENGFWYNNARAYLTLMKVGFDVTYFQEKKNIENAKKMFELNENRDLIYLKNGYEDWMERVKNWHFNEGKADNYHIKLGGLCKYGKRDPKETVRDQFEDFFSFGYATNGHQLPKDLQVTIEIDRDKIKSFKSIGFETEKLELAFDEFDREAWQPIDWIRKGSGKIDYPASLMPKDKSIRDVNPLLEPFEDEIKKLEAKGIDELPDWLAEQAEMAGYSVCIRDLYVHLKKFIETLEEQKQEYERYVKEQGIQNAPEFIPILRNYLEVRGIIDGKIHKVKKD